jgi:hypothetical protein
MIPISRSPAITNRAVILSLPGNGRISTSTFPAKLTARLRSFTSATSCASSTSFPAGCKS